MCRIIHDKCGDLFLFIDAHITSVIDAITLRIKIEFCLIFRWFGRKRGIVHIRFNPH
jgi:hypothetical protein